MTRQPNEKYAKWATSYQGFDGGNPNASIWFCGIEYGGGDDLVTKELLEDVENDWVEWQMLDGNRLPYFTPRDKQGNLIEDKPVDGPFVIAQSKIISRFLGWPVNTWKKMAGKDGECFKMNLYPLPFKSHDDQLWTKEHYERTGFISKSEYKTWNLNNRFPKLKQLVNIYSPDVLICFGLSLENEFLCAFCDNNDQIFETSESITIGKKEDKSERTLKFRYVNSNKTLLLITPFPTGAYGLNSNLLLEQVAEKAKSLSSKIRP